MSIAPSSSTLAVHLSALPLRVKFLSVVQLKVNTLVLTSKEPPAFPSSTSFKSSVLISLVELTLQLPTMLTCKISLKVMYKLAGVVVSFWVMLSATPVFCDAVAATAFLSPLTIRALSLPWVSMILNLPLILSKLNVETFLTSCAVSPAKLICPNDKSKIADVNTLRNFIIVCLCFQIYGNLTAQPRVFFNNYGNYRQNLCLSALTGLFYPEYC